MSVIYNLSKGKVVTYLLILVAAFLFSCVSDKDISPPDKAKEGIEGLTINDNFKYETIQATNINVTVSIGENPLAGVPLVIYTSAPASLYNEDPNIGGGVLVKGITDENGFYQSDIHLPAYLEEVYIQTDFIGIPDVTVAPVNNRTVTIEINDQKSAAQGRINQSYPDNYSTARINRAYSFLGNFNSQGVPDYLELESDEIDATFLYDVNQSLPERNPVPQAHPEYLAEGAETDVKLT